MNKAGLKIWFIVTFTLATLAIVIRSIWQIVVIPTPGTMIIFIPLILAMLGLTALFTYLVVRPEKLRSRAFIIGVTIGLTAGLLAGVTHFIRFIISPLADPALSKVIGFMVLFSSISAYLLVVRILWSQRRVERG